HIGAEGDRLLDGFAPVARARDTISRIAQDLTVRLEYVLCVVCQQHQRRHVSRFKGASGPGNVRTCGRAPAYAAARITCTGSAGGSTPSTASTATPSRARTSSSGSAR